MQVKKLTPVLFGNEVESCAKFWVERLGFEKTAEVPDGDKLAFVMLQKGGLEVMYQTYASVAKDLPHENTLAQRGPTFLYLEVDDLAQAMTAIAGAEMVLPERK